MRRNWANRALLGAGWVALVVAVGGILLYLGESQRRELVLLAAGATYLMFASWVALLLFLAARGWRSAAAAGVVIAGVLWTQLPMFVPDGRAAGGTEITVLQSNLWLGRADARAMARVVTAERVDVLTVNELTPSAVECLTAAGVDEQLPYRYIEPVYGGVGTGIYSRFPLHDTISYDGFTLRNLSATLRHPELGPVAVYAFHPLPPTAGSATWSGEMRRIREILDTAPTPALVGADFNATANHAAYRALLRNGFASAAEQAGAGRLPTYPADKRWGPLIGIDHVLLSGGTTTQVRTIDIPGSDHRAVLARVSLSIDPLV
ncbi:endonuclease/exonuclease/phosphatase family protein [Nocardia paucivorans]|uniref:endonuclease/exonuclease/phosphatase family protein n=1 Tax=Nocardia paucivorans TaxID=114259 RepID=UPI0002DD363C|nr:endonuclease/exonuclease/phosphatase family protein [Nocardia paucivorans]